MGPINSCIDAFPEIRPLSSHHDKQQANQRDPYLEALSVPGLLQPRRLGRSKVQARPPYLRTRTSGGTLGTKGKICTSLARNEHAVYGPIYQRLLTFRFTMLKAGMRRSLD